MTIQHLNWDPNITFPISLGIIFFLLILYGIWIGFFANEGLEDPLDDHDH